MKAGSLFRIHVTKHLDLTKIAACFLFVVPQVSLGQETSCKVNFMGSFNTTVYPDEHYYRYQFDLWRCGNTVVGLYSSAGGLQGDRHYPGTRKVSGVWTESLKRLELSEVEFTGTLTSDHLEGKLGEELTKPTKFDEGQFFPDSTEDVPTEFTSLEKWQTWADKKLKELDDKNPWWLGEIRKCLEGKGGCVNYGNHLKHRGRLDEAQVFWTKGCENGEVFGCKFSGNMSRYEELLTRDCESKTAETWRRNMACDALEELRKM